MSDLIDRIDVSVQRGSPIDAEVRPWLATLSALDPLLDVPPRSQAAATQGLAAFLGEARAMPVSAAAPVRLPVWKVVPFQKEATPMNVMATIALVLTLAFGGAGATAYAAQTSQPDDALYGVKLATEDLRLGLSQDPNERLVLSLSLIQTRTQEMAQLVQAQRPVPEQLQARLQNHIEVALAAATELDDAALPGVATQLNERSQVQLRTLAQLRTAAPADQVLRRAEAALTRLQTLAQLGVDDPNQFRQRVRTGQLEPTLVPGETMQPTSRPSTTPLGAGHGYGPGTGDCRDGLAVCTPEQDGNSYGPGPANPSVTPGAGPLATQTATTGGGYGPGPANGDSNGAPGGQPPITSDPTRAAPGGYGPGLQTTTAEPQTTIAPQVSCTPEQDGNSYGTGPGNPSVTPSGDHNSYGGNDATAQPGNGRP